MADPAVSRLPADVLREKAAALGCQPEDQSFAVAMDTEDPLHGLREDFHIPKMKDLPPTDPTLVCADDDCVYMCGNSLGLQPKGVRKYLEQDMDSWAKYGVFGHFEGARPWALCDEYVIQQSARIVGARPEEVACMNGLTVNLHLLLVSFYRPTATRHKILIEGKAFPSDHYAMESQIHFHGYDPATSLLLAEPRPGEHTLRTEDIVSLIEREGDSIAVVVFSGVQYYTGQLFNMAAITKAGHSKVSISTTQDSCSTWQPSLKLGTARSVSQYYTGQLFNMAAITKAWHSKQGQYYTGQLFNMAAITKAGHSKVSTTQDSCSTWQPSLKLGTASWAQQGQYQYYTGQLFNMAAITKAGHSKVSISTTQDSCSTWQPSLKLGTASWAQQGQYQYYTGQLFNMAAITKAGHSKVSISTTLDSCSLKPGTARSVSDHQYYTGQLFNMAAITKAGHSKQGQYQYYTGQLFNMAAITKAGHSKVSISTTQDSCSTWQPSLKLGTARSVSQYYTGQLFNMAAITKAGHSKGCVVGFDLAHAVGNAELHLHDWGVDFACWCTYKYMNSGAGGLAGAFVHENHADATDAPRFVGWWGHQMSTRFQMDNSELTCWFVAELDLSPGVNGFRLSNPPPLLVSPLLASLDWDRMMVVMLMAVMMVTAVVLMTVMMVTAVVLMTVMMVTAVVLMAVMMVTAVVLMTVMMVTAVVLMTVMMVTAVVLMTVMMVTAVVLMAVMMVTAVVLMTVMMVTAVVLMTVMMVTAVVLMTVMMVTAVVLMAVMMVTAVVLMTVMMVTAVVLMTVMMVTAVVLMTVMMVTAVVLMAVMMVTAVVLMTVMMVTAVVLMTVMMVTAVVLMLLPALQVFQKTTMADLRRKSVLLTGYLELLIKKFYPKPAAGEATGRPWVDIITPSDPAQRGCQLSLMFSVPIGSVFTQLEKRGVADDADVNDVDVDDADDADVNDNNVFPCNEDDADVNDVDADDVDDADVSLQCDKREPNVLRIAPAPLYNSFSDVHRFVSLLGQSLQAAKL
ncbi:KYNU [Branchiostoma lanceolatum]|uniref:Kynureninase n=1 Tax=Branchiostoma lanceolatum TaxID=7740 RepID=A0A8K0ADS0_BRALA|nr:KYNU [Branchiostoma lanceolatum]